MDADAVPYEFQEWEEELEPAASSARSGGPPRKPAGVGVLDPPFPPRKPPGPLSAKLAGFWLRMSALLLLAGIGLSLVLLLLRLF